MKKIMLIAIIAALGVFLLSNVASAKSSGGGKPGTVSPPQATSCPDPNTSGPSKGRPTVKDCTPDADGDGVSDAADLCPGTHAGTTVNSSGCHVLVPPPDADNDGVADTTDNCPNVANDSQTNTDGDGKDDACDN